MQRLIDNKIAYVFPGLTLVKDESPHTLWKTDKGDFIVGIGETRTNISDFSGDYQIMMGNQPTARLSDFKKFCQTNLKNKTAMLFIGHSLGGCVALTSQVPAKNRIGLNPGINFNNKNAANGLVFRVTGDMVSAGYIDKNMVEFNQTAINNHCVANFTGFVSGTEENQDFEGKIKKVVLKFVYNKMKKGTLERQAKIIKG